MIGPTDINKNHLSFSKILKNKGARWALALWALEWAVQEAL